MLFIIRGDNNRVGIIAPLHVSGQSTIMEGTSGRHFNYGSIIFSHTVTEYSSIVADASIISKTRGRKIYPEAVSKQKSDILNALGSFMAWFSATAKT